MKTGREINQETLRPGKGGRFLDRMNRILRMRGKSILSILLILSKKILLIHEGFLKLARCAFEVRGRAKQYSNTLALSHANRPDL